MTSHNILHVHVFCGCLFTAQYLGVCGLEENTDFLTVVGFQIISDLFVKFLFIFRLTTKGIKYIKYKNYFPYF